jgi:2-oxoglutarate ferredoxin oxidoreductase subunit gamma
MDDFEVRFTGTGGQGLQLSARILADALNRDGRTVSLSQSYEPTSRGGVSRSDLVVSRGAVDYPLVTALDYLVVLDQSAVAEALPLVKPDALIVVDARRVPEPPSGGFALHALPLSESALALGNERVTNIIALAALVGLSDLCSRESLDQAIRAGVPAKLLALNLEAVERGFALTAEVATEAV